MANRIISSALNGRLPAVIVWTIRLLVLGLLQVGTAMSPTFVKSLGLTAPRHTSANTLPKLLQATVRFRTSDSDDGFHEVVIGPPLSRCSCLAPSKAAGHVLPGCLLEGWLGWRLSTTPTRLTVVESPESERIIVTLTNNT